MKFTIVISVNHNAKVIKKALLLALAAKYR